MNAYMITGVRDGATTSRQRFDAPSAREAAELFRQAYPTYGVASVGMLVEIPAEFWGGPDADPGLSELDLSRSRIVEVPKKILTTCLVAANRRAVADGWAESYARQGKHKAWHPIFTDGLVTHYQFD